MEKIRQVREWIFVDSSDLFIAPILEDETTGRIIEECRGDRDETKLYEEKEQRFVTYKGIKIPQNAKVKTAEIWLRANKRMGINPYALYVRKTGWKFFASCVADGMFAEEELEGRKKISKGGVAVFEIPDFVTMTAVQKKMIGWRKRKNILAESTNVAVFFDGENIVVKAAFADDSVMSMLKDFRYDRKTDSWTGKDIKSAIRLVRTDGIPDTKTYRKGLYFLCEAGKTGIDYLPCFVSLFS